MSATAQALPVSVDTATYTGYWIANGQWYQGDRVIDLPPGDHWIAVGNPDRFLINVSATGDVTVVNGESATGGAGTLTFATTTISVTRNGFIGESYFNYAATVPGTAVGAVQLVKGLSYNLCATVTPGACHLVHVDGDGTTTSSQPTSTLAVSGGFWLVTRPLALVRNGFTGLVILPYGGTFPAGDSTVTVVADLPYRVCATLHSGGCFIVDVDANGDLSGSTAAATFSGNTLAFETTPVQVDRGHYQGFVNFYYGPELTGTPVSSVLMPRGLQYRLCATPSGAEACFPVDVGIDGSVSASGPGSGSGSTVTLANAELLISTSPSKFAQVWYGGPGVTGSGSTTIVPGGTYRLEVDGALTSFAVGLDCTVTPASFTTPSGVHVTLGCELPSTDADGDGVADDLDLCPGFADQQDMDADGTPDGCDACPADFFNDSDGDGACDADDPCALDADDDADADGVCADLDPCPADPDDDADADGVCADADVCPADAENDADGDGVCGDVDACAAGDDGVDTDDDGTADDCDVCPDDPANDADSDDLCADADPCPIDAANDADGDGLCADADPCPLDAADDADGDGLCADVDPCAADANNDADGDGLCESDDNCMTVSNPNQSDVDADGVGDACDGDDDGDGVLDSSDECLESPGGAPVLANGCSVDEQCRCTNPWKNHGAYVACVSHAAGSLLTSRAITSAQKDAIVSSAAETNCGKMR